MFDPPALRPIGRSQAFTLLELLIVLLIAGLLLVLGLAKFKPAIDAARGTQAKSYLRASLSDAGAYLPDHDGSFTGLAAADLSSVGGREPSPVVACDATEVADVGAAATAGDSGRLYFCASGGDYAAAFKDASGAVWVTDMHESVVNGIRRYVAAAATLLAAGQDSSCAVQAAGIGGLLYCWGNSNSGKLGNGVGGGNAANSTPILISGVSDAKSVSLGSQSGCALSHGGGVKCWGENSYGVVGDGSTGNVRTSPVAVHGVGGAGTLSGATQVSVGPYNGEHACARLSTGAVACWGRNQSGQLGRGSWNTWQSGALATPELVSGITTATKVVVGSGFSCVLLADQTVKCWGAHSIGQVGDGSLTGADSCDAGSACTLTPTTVTGISGATDIDAGANAACALLSGGTVKCWGGASVNALGNRASSGATVSNTGTPVTVLFPNGGGDLTDVASFAYGVFGGCAVRSAGDIVCWGQNSSDAFQLTKVRSGFAGVTSLAAGQQYVCAVSGTGSAELVECAGANSWGQLGDGTTDFSSSPVTTLLP